MALYLTYSCSTQQNIPIKKTENKEEQRKQEIITDILNFKGQDTILFNNYKKEIKLTRHEDRYVLYSRDLYYDEDFLIKTMNKSLEELRNQPSYDIELARKYVEIKNITKNRDITKDDLPIKQIIQELITPQRLLKYNIEKYVDAIITLEPESNIANDYAVHGGARNHLIQIKNTAQEMSQQQNNKELETLIKELEQRLELNQRDTKNNNQELYRGIYKATNQEGKQVYVVVAEITDPKKGEIAREFTAINTATETFLKYSLEVLTEQAKIKRRNKLMFEIQQRPTITQRRNDVYEITMIFHKVGTQKQNQAILESIKKTYDLQKETQGKYINTKYVPNTKKFRIKQKK